MERLKDKPFLIVGINSDSDPGRAKERLREQQITWRNILDGGTDGPVSSAWRVREWPTLYLLDAAGTIRYAGAELRSQVPVDDRPGSGERTYLMDRYIDSLLAELKK